jgi:hypothetical protein
MENAVITHWGEISKSTSKFCGFYAEVERKNQSGKCEDDKVFMIRNLCVISDSTSM